MDEILKYYHSNVSYLAVLFGGTVNNAVQGGLLILSVEKTLNFKCDDSSEGYAFEASFTAFIAVKPHISPT